MATTIRIESEWGVCKRPVCRREQKQATLDQRGGFCYNCHKKETGTALPNKRDVKDTYNVCDVCTQEVKKSQVNDEGRCFKCACQAKDKEICSLKAQLDETIVQYASLISRVNKALGGKLVLE